MTVESIKFASSIATQNLNTTEKAESASSAGSIFTMAEVQEQKGGKGIDKEKTLATIKKERESGNAECINQFQYIFRQWDRHKLHTQGSFIMLDRVPEGCKTLGDVKRKLNLPDGCLVNNNPKLNGGGGLDDKDAEAPLSISVDILADGLGISPKEIKALFE